MSRQGDSPGSVAVQSRPSPERLKFLSLFVLDISKSKPEELHLSTIEQNDTTPAADVSLWLAIVPILVLIGLLGANVYLYGEDSSYGPNQIALLMAAATAGLIGMIMKVPFATMMQGVKTSISSSVLAMLILLLIGALTGTWMMSGVVPAMIYYGLDVLSPEYFLVAAATICALVSVVTGSSWSTVATVGVALLGIGNALGIHDGLIAGSVISGAYFGDKISPLSDTTNLASAMAGAELITHIRYMLWTTVPSFLIALAIFMFLGFNLELSELATDNSALKEQIANRFNLNPVIFTVPALVLVLVLLRTDAVVALFVGALAGGIMAIVMQADVVSGVAGWPVDKVATQENSEEMPSYFQRSYVALVNSMAYETELVASKETDAFTLRKNELAAALETQPDDVALQLEMQQVDAGLSAAKLLAGKGMAGMLNTVWLILTAMCFGGMMEACGLLQRITNSLISFAKSDGSLVATTAGSCVFVNVAAADQYLSIVVPGRMFRSTFKQRGLAPENLSRTLEDSGTVTSVLIPWNTCGAAQHAVLGVSVLAFAPYCFFNIISPLMTLLFAFIGIRIARLAGK